jgi:hypothetical protein
MGLFLKKKRLDVRGKDWIPVHDCARDQATNETKKTLTMQES